ncbi:hypothetical protein KKA14_18945, partial [bacterium]|nr:hypothetical protein [bacterium]
LGNQFFCYAISRRIALVNNAELIVDDVSGFAHDHNCKRQCQLDRLNNPCSKATASKRLEPLQRVRRYFKRRWNQCLSFERCAYLVQEGVDFGRMLNFRVRPIWKDLDKEKTTSRKWQIFCAICS